MHILLTAATSAEIAPLTTFIRSNWKGGAADIYDKDNVRISVLITGVGTTATCYALTKKLLQGEYDLALQAGIAGSYDRGLALGSVVNVVSDRFGDMGAEDHYNFIDVFELGLAEANDGILQNGILHAPATSWSSKLQLEGVSGLTLNTVSGSSFTAEARYKKYGCQLESMEGAAFHYVCLQQRVPFMQIRGISNYVEVRDRASWKIREAVEGLNEVLVGLLDRN
jgi:futalosine hydrolase